MSRHGNSGRGQKNKHGSGGGSKGKGLKDIRINECVKIGVNLALERFQYSDENEMEFPSSLTSTERAFIHRVSLSLGYVSKSRGKGSKRFLTIRKKAGMQRVQSRMSVELSSSSMQTVRSLLHRFPVTSKEHTDLLPRTASHTSDPRDTDNGRDKNRTNGRLINGIPQVPQRRSASELDAFRRSLPVYERQEEIIQIIREHRVVLVVGETGSGKTTQIPQFLLDDSSRKGAPCRIFCTQPRRLATIAVAERVAAERGEAIGQTVGYQIRLESRVSPKTLLTFCTSGVLLRTLMSGDAALASVTHVIVDEVHERDGLTDFLLIKLRDLLQTMPALRLILSSAALDEQLFLRYFGSCPIIHIKGRPFEVKQLFLEDILRMMGYANKDMIKYKKERQREEKTLKSCSEWREDDEGGGDDGDDDDDGHQSPDSCHEDAGDTIINDLSEPVEAVVPLEPWLSKEMDSCISSVFQHQDADVFVQLFNLILNENVMVDYTHSETSATALMVAAARGFLTQMEKLISMGANLHLKANNGWTALDWAKHFQQTEAVDLLESYLSMVESGHVDESTLVQRGGAELSPEEQQLLEAYHHSFDDDKVDLDLVMHLLHNICTTSEDGAVLIFLPGYEEIVGLKDRITCDDKRFSEYARRFQVFTLHSNMQTMDQKKVMRNTPPGVRKIILSTNIAETSITINDVVFVIDSGKVKEKSFDAIHQVSMLKMGWISKASALQRKGRAGRCRPGICFHMFSRLRFNSMQEFQVPQLLRMPLQELCLHTKLLAPINCPIADFLARAPEPPPIHIVKNAVHMLKMVDAMEPSEDLTELGYHLADLPVEPHLGKMVLCGVVLKCLDPILTIACMLAHRDPFVLPAQASEKRAALLCRKRFTAGTFSDHMALLRAFQAWQKACNDGWERSFCEKNFLSQATLEIIVGMRTQLLGQLRAIGFVRANGAGDIRDVNLYSENWSVVKAALVAGMYPNLIHVDRHTCTLSSNKEKKVRFHPTSVLCQPQGQQGNKKTPSANGQMASVQALPTDWLIYDEMTRAHRIASVRCCSMVSPVTVTIFGGSARLPASALQEPTIPKDDALNDSSDSEAEEGSVAHLAQLKIDEWLHFQLDSEIAAQVFQLRQKWHTMFLRRIRSPSKPWIQQDEATLQALVTVLGTEEQYAGIQQPTGIGQRPRLTNSFETDTSRRSSPPVTQRDATERPRRNVSSPTHRPPKLSPASGLSLNKLPPASKTKLSPASKNKLSPASKTKLSPASETKLSPASETKLSPASETKLSPASETKLSPASETKLSPASETKLSPASKQSSRDEALLQSKHTSDHSPASGKSAARYFVMKSSSLRHMETSRHRGVWSTSSSNQLKLNAAFVHSHAVYLAFSVQDSVYFQGYARMTSGISEEHCEDWSSPPSGPGAVFGVEWVRTESLPFQFAQHLLNPWNDNRRVQLSRDGQELEPQVGSQLLQLWEETWGGQCADGVNPQHSEATVHEDLSALKIH